MTSYVVSFPIRDTVVRSDNNIPWVLAMHSNVVSIFSCFRRAAATCRSISCNTGNDLSLWAKERVLAPYISSERRNRIERVLENRTRNVVVVLEHLHSKGNENAVYRSMDALGFQEAHSITADEESEAGQASGDPRTDAGARKWLQIRKWHTTRDCLLHLKSRGYQIIATAMNNRDNSSLPVQDVDFDNKIAFVFGAEKDGVSDLAVEMADVCCFIPMIGFTQSFNVSVAAALILYETRMRRIRMFGRNGDLTDEEKRSLLVEFYVRALTSSKARRVLQKYKYDATDSSMTENI
ncbi:tRNA (guanosine(18)-2'-O)-methyltransferase-like [Corticium candelabrum]|uniref:tRNA (guanosine(18)-2'-O)-methyltransferase-like n=1 Tax=Corticium candelabrum TaxID=121492 RepID=UPI002E272235|nr:tRNA (guanosine(18)-2'-O)-methyltransferase-like [Corticium candelabrum]